MLVYLEILEHFGQCLWSYPIKCFLYAEGSSNFLSALHFSSLHIYLVVVVFLCWRWITSFHKQAVLARCWGTSGESCGSAGSVYNLITHLYPSSSKLGMFEILSLHGVIFITFLANIEKVLPESSHSMLPCRNNFSATFQLVSNDSFLLGAGQIFSLSGMLICLSLV